MEKVMMLMMKRAEIYTCSYDTAWKQWMTDEEKAGYTYKQITDYMINS